MAFFIEHKGTRTGRTLIQRQNILSQSPAAPPRKTVQTHPFRTGLFRLTGRESHRRHNLFARMDMDFLVNVPDVNRDRVRTDTKLGSDLFIAETADTDVILYFAVPDRWGVLCFNTAHPHARLLLDGSFFRMYSR